MQTTNPFPGMNPYLQSRWPDAHTTLIAYIRDAISARLPGDLTVMAEECVSIDAPDQEGDLGASIRADVAVAESVGIRLPEETWPKPDAQTLTLTQPEQVRTSRTHRWLEIRDIEDRVITVIELLSPSNKTPDAAYRFSKRQDSLLLSGINILEIDLIRGGHRTVPDDFVSQLRETESTTFLVIAGRAHDAEGRALYYCPLQERLPVVAVPLRQSDDDVPLDLQPLIDRCYQTGRYWQISQRLLTGPALTADEQVWADGLLVAAGLKD